MATTQHEPTDAAALRSVNQFDEVALALRKTSDGAAIVVGPALIHGDDWAVGVIAGGQDPYVTMVILGTVMAELDPDFAAHFATVISVRREGDISHEEAKHRRAQLIAALKEKFRNVHAFHAELAAAGFALGLWPCPKLRNLCSQLEQEDRTS